MQHIGLQLFMMYARSFPVLVSMALLFGVIEVSAFNPDSYKPYQWGWEAQTKDFANVPRLPCPTEDLRRCVCKSDSRKSTYLVDCDKTVWMGEAYKLQAPHNVTHLRVRGSYGIGYVPNGSFNQTIHLVYLDLSRNTLCNIESHAFAGLDNLAVLDLSDNLLRASAEFLQPLSSLQVLNLCYQLDDSFFMDTITNLKQLEILAFSPYVLSKDKVLQLQNTSVTYLSINGGSDREWSRIILNEFPNVEIERGVLSSWTTLKSLQLKYLRNLGFTRSNDVFRNLSGLHVENLYIESGLCCDIGLDGFQAPNIQAFAMHKTDVWDVNFEGTDLQAVEWLDISSNTRLHSFYLQYMHRLHCLDLSNRKLSSGRCVGPMDVILPKSLISIDYSGTPICVSIFFNNPEILHPKCLNLRNTGLTVLTGQQLASSHCQTNYSVTISNLDLQDNNIQCIKPTFFTHCDWSALNVLKLSNNRLDLGGSDTCGNIQPAHFMDFLQPLWNLTDLYLNSNSMVYNLPPNMLINQTKLRSLHLSDMALMNLTLKMRHILDLNLLDLSHNSIQCLYTSSLRDINRIIDYSPTKMNVSRSLVLNLSHNPLRCSCACLEFYQWMRKVRPYITFTDFDSYHCAFDNGTTTHLSDLNLIVDILRSQCIPTDWSPVITMTTTIISIYMFIFAVTTLFRFRHTLRYIWLKHRMHRQYLERQLLDPKYNFDAFVSCVRTDAIWVKNNFLPKLENQQTGLKFCVAQRNFMVGATIIDNIIRSINQSRKVVYVISQNFLKSGWCKEELLMGHQESLSRGKNILICIFMPDIIQNQLPDRFRFILNHVTCIKWPRDPAAQQVFWIMLQRTLLDGKQPNAANEFEGNRLEVVM